MRLVLFVLIALAACTHEPPSEIVKKVEEAGAGNLAAASTDSIVQWFRQNAAVANEVKALCAPIRASAPANWSDSTEGRVCQAASIATVFKFTPRKGDGRGFEAGK
jgi:hypothetical protein